MTNDMKLYIFTQTLAIAVLVATITLGLLPALLGGLFVYFSVEYGSEYLERRGVILKTGRIIFLTLIALILIAASAAAVSATVSWVSEGPESMVVLLKRLAHIVDAGRSYVPLWAQKYLPANFEELQAASSEWLKHNAEDMNEFGREAGLLLIHIVLGMVIGGMVAIKPAFQGAKTPLAKAVHDRILSLSTAFRRIVFSQVRISALNTFLTAIFLVIVLPIMGSHMPMAKAMIAVTFFAGLLPIVGNLISNSVIFLVALGVSPPTAAVCLLYLVLIHKLEYFFNAHIIGTQIKARAWEILLAMVVMETVFGLTGLIAAPIYYAYIKDELTAKKLI
jgi:predicted PurR-regulated permease PerM